MIPRPRFLELWNASVALSSRNTNSYKNHQQIFRRHFVQHHWNRNTHTAADSKFNLAKLTPKKMLPCVLCFVRTTKPRRCYLSSTWPRKNQERSSSWITFPIHFLQLQKNDGSIIVVSEKQIWTAILTVNPVTGRNFRRWSLLWSRTTTRRKNYEPFLILHFMYDWYYLYIGLIVN